VLRSEEVLDEPRARIAVRPAVAGERERRRPDRSTELGTDVPVAGCDDPYIGAVDRRFEGSPGGRGHLPSVGLVAGQRLVDEEEHGGVGARRRAQPVVVVGRSEQVGVGTDDPPPGQVGEEAVAAPRLPEGGEAPLAPVVLAVEPDVVVAGDAVQRRRQIGEQLAGEAIA